MSINIDTISLDKHITGNYGEHRFYGFCYECGKEGYFTKDPDALMCDKCYRKKEEEQDEMY